MPQSNQQLFKEPQAKDVPLSDSTAATIHEFNKSTRASLMAMCWYAYGLRKHNLKKKQGGRGGSNRQSLEYKPAFWRWYTKEKLAEVYGSVSSFTHYAFAGRLLVYVRWQYANGARYLDQLPASVYALYYLSQSLGERGEKVVPEAKRRLQRWFAAPRQDGSGITTHVIHPHLTVGEAKRLVDGAQQTTEPHALKPTQNHILVASILVSKADLLAFVKKTGAKRRGTPTLADIKALEVKLKKLIHEYNKTSASFLIESHVIDIEETYNEKLDYDKKI